MNINSAFPSRFWKTTDLNGEEFQMTIEKVVVETVDDDTHEQKPVVYFDGHEKGLVLNRTNANAIADILGEETDNWIGHKIIVYPARTNFKGRQVDCLRVRVSSQGNGSTPSQTSNIVTPGQLRELIESWKQANPASAEDVEGFRSWVEKNIGLDPEQALSAGAWSQEGLTTALELLTAEDVSF